MLRLKIFVVVAALLFGLVGARLSASRPRELHEPDEEKNEEEVLLDVVVGFKDDNDGEYSVASMISARSSSAFNLGRIEYQYERANAVAMKVTAKQRAELLDDKRVAYVEDDSQSVLYSTAQTQYSTTENVPWGITVVQGNDPSIPAPQNTGGCFRVCVVDSGLMVGHPDLPFQLNSTNIEGMEFNIGEDETWYNPAPSASHGTHVTGTIFASGNGQGVVGVIPYVENNTCLMVARVFGDDEGTQSTVWINQAAEWCADNGAKVINMSLGSSTHSTTAENIYKSLREEGVLVIAAAGNNGGSGKSYPASYDDVISVAAIDEDFDKASFSQYNDQVTISAPGVDVLSTVGAARIFDNDTGNEFQGDVMGFSVTQPTEVNQDLVDCGPAFETCVGVTNKICLIERGQTTFADKAANCEAGGGMAVIVYNNLDGTFSGTLGENSGVTIPVLGMSREGGLALLNNANSVRITLKGGGYAEKSGTSMATPHVSGIAAKIWAARPECTSEQIREALLNTAIDLGDSGRDDEFGYGLVQARDAYQYLMSLQAPCGIGMGSNPAGRSEVEEDKLSGCGGGRRRGLKGSTRKRQSLGAETV